MIQDKKIFYWAPHFSNIATPKAVVNSAEALTRYSKNFNCHIINFFGEFNIYNLDSKFKNVNFINYFSKVLIKLLPKRGKIFSRFSFFVLFSLSFFPLKNLIQKEKPDYLIVHLITSLPLILLILFKFDTKFILRISGTPKLGFIRKVFWRIALKKIHLITCPTINSLEFLQNSNIVKKNKIHLLLDPILEVNLSRRKMKKDNLFKEKNPYFCSAGRLTKQKNFLLLCKAFKIISKKYPNLKLIIAGDGEEKNKILSYIKKNNLNDKIYLSGHLENIFNFFKNSKAFILPSLWEDPGFVLIEAAFCRTPIISSTFINKSNKIILNGTNGYLFDNNNLESLIQTIENFLNNKNDITKISFQALKMSKDYSIFRHYISLSKLLNKYD